jgi:hypothetical protein
LAVVASPPSMPAIGVTVERAALRREVEGLVSSTPLSECTPPLSSE